MAEIKRYWSHRIIHFNTATDPANHYYELMEVHFENDVPKAYGTASLVGDTVEDIQVILQRMLDKARFPPLSEKDTFEVARNS